MILSFVSSETRRKIWRTLDIVMAALGVFALLALIVELGFYLDETALQIIRYTVDTLIIVFVAQELLRWFFVNGLRQYARDRWLENLMALLALYLLLSPATAFDIAQTLLPKLPHQSLTLVYLATTQAVIVGSLIIKGVRYNSLVARIKLHPGALFVISFALIILIGAGLLLLPKASTESISVVDAFFTATSAVCVTGLIVVDTATAFTPFGQTIIIALIQVGGLGIMTLTTFFALFFSGGISVRERLMISTVLSQENIGEVSGILVRIALYTFVIEAVGALGLYLTAGGSLGTFDTHTFLSAVFHAISAFCNAGFSLFSDNLYDSSVRWNYGYLSIIMLLITLGGFGFAVLSNIVEYRRGIIKWRSFHRRLSVTTKLVLISSAVLVAAGTLCILLLESDNSFADFNWWDKTFHALFFSVSCRTAGFNILPMEALGVPALLVMIILMWVGASPASTGGGVKTTTVAVAALNVINIVRGKERVEIFNRQISIESIRRAFAAILLSAFVLGGACVLLVIVEPHLNPLDLIFEAVSAMSTVGLSRGITDNMSDAGKIVIILVMFVGRVGILTVLFALTNPAHEPRYKLPEESIMVG